MPAASSDHVTIPAAVLIEGTLLPRNCVRHGRAVAAGMDVTLQSRPRHKLRPVHAGVVQIAARTTAHLAAIQRVPVRGWPFCPACLRRRRRLRLVAGVMFFGGLALFIGVIVTGVLLDDPQPLMAIPVIGGFVSAVLSGFVFGQTSSGHIARAVVSDDGRWVVFSRPHPNFVAELRGVVDDTAGG